MVVNFPPNSDTHTQGMNWGINKLNQTQMLILKTKDRKWFIEDIKIYPYGKLDLYPASTVLNYGQGIFEGQKCFKWKDKSFQLFRMFDNFNRINKGCKFLSMPEMSKEVYAESMKRFIIANDYFIPDHNPPYYFYIRPQLFGSGSSLGLSSSPEFTFVIWGTIIGPTYNKSLLKAFVSTSSFRALPEGSGGVKCICNYAGTIGKRSLATQNGYDDVLYLSASEPGAVEEFATSNVFFLFDDCLMTPHSGSILPGVLRDSILQLTSDKTLIGVPGRVGTITWEQMKLSKMSFSCATAIGIVGVNSYVKEDTGEKN